MGHFPSFPLAFWFLSARESEVSMRDGFGEGNGSFCVLVEDGIDTLFSLQSLYAFGSGDLEDGLTGSLGLFLDLFFFLSFVPFGEK